MKRMKSPYLFTGIFLIALILGAFTLPAVTLQLQDSQSMNEAHYEFRPGLDYSIAYPEYDAILIERLKNFAIGLAEGKNYYVVTSGYTEEEDETALKRKIFDLLEATGFITYFLGWQPDFEQYEIIEQEHYIIYDGEPINGVAFICRYFELEVEGLYKMKYLIDGKDNTVYYMELFDVDWSYLVSNRWFEHLDRFIYSFSDMYWTTQIGMLESYETDKNGVVYYAEGFPLELVSNPLDEIELYFRDEDVRLTVVDDYVIYQEEEDVFYYWVGIKEIMDLVFPK